MRIFFLKRTAFSAPWAIGPLRYLQPPRQWRYFVSFISKKIRNLTGEHTFSYMTIWVILLAAPFIGSFLALFAQRYPAGGSLILGRSHCDACGRTLAVCELVPIASWIWLAGRCRTCKGSIGLFPLFMELAPLALALWAATQTSGAILAITCLFGWWLLLLGAIDARTFVLPDVLTYPLALAGLIVSWWLMPGRIVDHLIGAAAGFAVFAAIALCYRKVRGREGLGLGDAKLMAALGAWLSWQSLPTVVLFAAIGGLGYALIQAACTRDLSLVQRIPFGTFLAAAGWVVWLYGPLVL